MKNRLLIIFIFIGGNLTGCIGDTSSDKSSYINQNFDIEGTWYGIVTNRVTVSWTDFNSASEGQSELYWVIKRNNDDSYDFPNCRGENKEIEVVDNTFVFEDIEYIVESEDVIRAEINNVDSGVHTYFSVELNRVNSSIESIGSITGTWSNLNDTTSSSDLICAEIGDVTLTTSNGDNIQEVIALVSNGQDFSYLSSRTGTNAHDYIQIEYDGNELHGFSYNGFEEMLIDYNTSPENGFNITFTARTQELDLSGNIIIEVNSSM